jgi:NAD(P)-dependent dehydrogenase (short-subunit alcohol dehydrogenase family)
MKIQDNAFLVAGGGSGLGAATARMLAKAGGKVLIADVNAAGDGVAQEIGAGARFIRTDVTDEASTQAAVDACIAAFGAIHGVVNCAGIAPGERVVGRNGPHSLESFERAIRINLIGTFNVIRLAAATMTVQQPFPSGERRESVNTSSVASF